MNQIIDRLIEDLINLSSELDKLSPSRNENLFSSINSSAPPLNIKDISRIPVILANKLSLLGDLNFDDDDTRQMFEEITNRLHYVRQNILPGFFNSPNIKGKVDSFITVMQWINFVISPICNDWQNVDENHLPSNLVQRLRLTQGNLDQLITDKETFSDRVEKINASGPIIEQLAHKLGNLDDLQERMETYRQSAKDVEALVREDKTNTDAILEQLRAHRAEAEAIIKRANEAYSMATTVGLAGSFDDRAKSLKLSQGLWLAGLIAALMIGGFIGHDRFDAVQTALDDNLQPGYIWILIFLSILSFGAPIWFAWLATKQIGQRFKLSEDYAFKASVAKAYEGYRKEAASIDKEMEARLFASALTRLDELPLRFMDKENHGSPWQELLNNPSFLKLFKEKPEILEKLLEAAKTQLTKSSSATEAVK